MTTHEETSKLQKEIDSSSQRYLGEIDALQQTVSDRTRTLRNEFSQTRDKLEENLQALKNQVVEELEKRFANLETAKVSRADLAEVLFELCLKVKGSDFVPDLQEIAENKIQTEFLLPEQRTAENSR